METGGCVRLPLYGEGQASFNYPGKALVATDIFFANFGEHAGENSHEKGKPKSQPNVMSGWESGL